MIYRIILEADNGETVSFTPIAQVLFEVQSSALEQGISAEIFAGVTRAVNAVTPPTADGTPSSVTTGGVMRGRPARSIYVISVDADSQSRISAGEVISSSMDLSKLLGYHYNMVLQAFSRSRTKRRDDLLGLKGETRKQLDMTPIEGTLRGVHFCYLDEWNTRPE